MNSGAMKFIDLFCGIGGFRYGLEAAAREIGSRTKCVFSSDIDENCRKSYAHNFRHVPEGDITKIKENDVPDHDLLLAGFPCQPFSIIGQRKGFLDTRGTLFFDIARILNAKRPSAFVLENVKLLKGHDGGRTLRKILDSLRDLGYKTDFRILNALDFGLPQKRERIWIVGFLDDQNIMNWPTGGIPMMPLSQVLESDVDKKHYASEDIQKKRLQKLVPPNETTIWHENKAGNISAYPYSCALRAGASYNYLLVDGKRRLTPREMLRLQGFPDSFEIVCSDHQTRKQAGNSLPVDVAKAVTKQTLLSLAGNQSVGKYIQTEEIQLSCCETRS
jgi:DNA (cytosine-5)-methyltransferase 1